MTNPKENTKKTGDLHPPDVELEPPFQEGMTDAVDADGTPRGRGKATGEAGDREGSSRESSKRPGGKKI
jgi:hypothetical protein